MEKSDLDNLIELNARRLWCPEPIMLLHSKINGMEKGELVRITTTDPSTTRDVPKFCEFLGHELVETKISQKERKYCFTIRKK